jgi:2-alkenal reductase
LAFITGFALISLACQTITNLPLADPTATAVAPADQSSDPGLNRQAEPTSRPVEQPAEQNRPQPIAVPDLVSIEDTLVQLYEQANPGVVAIRVLTESGESLGSGFVIDQEGHIVTNYHVVEGVTDLEVDFPSGYKTRGEVVGSDTDSDLAVLRVDAPAEELHPLPMGDSSQIRVGQTVVAIGNPFGYTGTMTTGIISAVGRTLESMRLAPGGQPFTAGDILQTDAPINPGNSGGPLLNLNGEVIGVNRAIETFNFTAGEGEPLNSGIGFAIAINIVKRVAPALISEGKYDYPYLGISCLPEVSLLQQEALGLPRATGAYVTEVTAGGPADEAGLRGAGGSTDFPGLVGAGGDLIIAVDGQPVRVFNDLLSYLINNKSPGDVILLTIIREDREMEVELTLGRRP